jgi:endonuclease III related protein
MPLRNRLLTLYTDLAAHYAHEPHWWPILTGDPHFEVLVGMVLVQQTRWQTVEAAIRRLIERGWMSPAGLLAADTTELAQSIRPCAFHNQKAPGLQALALHVLEHYAGDTAALLNKPDASQLRAELLGLPRIGRETADTIMLYGGGHPMFIVDAYARRILARYGLPCAINFLKAPYDTVRLFVEETIASGPVPEMAAERRSLPDFVQPKSPLTTFYWDFHAVLLEASIHHCLATNTRCATPGLRLTFVDSRKCAAHCLECAACPLSGECRDAINRIRAG